MDERVKLTKAQRELLGRLRGGSLLMLYTPPGAEEKRQFYIENPYSDEDARTCWSVIDKGLLHNEGGGMWVIAEAGLAALKDSRA